MTVTRRQYATGGTITSTANITTGTTSALASPAVVGNLLKLTMTVDKDAGGINVPAGWTVIANQSGAQVSQLTCWKLAAGGETTATVTWTTPQKGWTPILAEYQSDVGFASPPVGPSTSPAYVDVAGTSVSLGPLTATAPGLPVIVGSIDSITGTGTTSTAFQLAAAGWTWVGSGTRATSDAGGVTSPTGAPGCSLLERNTQATAGEVVPATTVTWPWSDETIFTEFLIREAASGGSDTTAPTVPGSVTATANSATQVTVTWAPSTDAVGVASYRVRRGGVDLTGATAVTGTSFVDTTVSPSTAYSYTVSAVDAAGNRSAESTPATVTTPSAGTTPTLVSRIVGIPSGTTLPVAVKTTGATTVRLQVSTSPTFASGIISGSGVTPNAQGDSQLTVGGLTAGAAYYYRVGMTVSGAETFSAISSKAVKTAPSGQASFAFDFGSCCNAADSASMTAIAARSDDLFFHLGDLYYADGSGTDTANMRAKHDAKIQATNHAAVFSGTPSSYTPSDHDGMTNGSTAGIDPTAWTNWNTVYREKWPTPALPATGAYYTFSWGRVRFIHLDGRSFKAGTTALGATQKQWLKDTIGAATEPVIVIVQADSSWIGTGDTDNWSGFTAERTELGNFFAASGKPIVMLAGDAHMLAADDGTNAPGGITLFQAAPLNNTVSLKGGPYTAGTYPTTTGGTVQQYGRVVVTDTGSQISLAFTGYSSDNTARISLTKTVTVTAAPAAPNRVLVGGTWVDETPRVLVGGTWVPDAHRSAI